MGFQEDGKVNSSLRSSKMKLDSNMIMQVSIIVKDIDKTAGNIARLFGMDVPEVFTLDKLGENHAEYLGVPTESKIKLAVFKMGDIDLELIEPDEKPSTFKTFLEENGEGIHHLGLVVKDKEQAMQTLKENGASIRYWGTYPGGSYYIADTKDLIGTFLNIKHND
jgi:methylmalonyl-CoA/ethylmalonyl-CoA epimerase